jgi:hypothetical protein
LIVIVFLLHAEVLPDVRSTQNKLVSGFLLLVFEEEVVITSCVALVSKTSQVEGRELETFWVGHCQMMHALQELQEHGGLLSWLLSLESEPEVEGVSETDKLFFHQDAETVQGAVVGVDDELGQS